MGATSIWHWAIVLLVVVLLFGRGKISEVMGDVAKGIKSFKKGMTDDPVPEAQTTDPKVIDNNTAAPAATVAENESNKAS
jgi:sec-independent protein translocase protein TatA